MLPGVICLIVSFHFLFGNKGAMYDLPVRVVVGESKGTFKVHSTESGSFSSCLAVVIQVLSSNISRKWPLSNILSLHQSLLWTILELGCPNSNSNSTTY